MVFITRRFLILTDILKTKAAGGKQSLYYIIVLFVEISRKFITAKLSTRKPGSLSVLLICYYIIILLYDNIITYYYMII
jgi:hypothetical protein